MELIDRILADGNIKAAIRAVQGNHGAPGVDKMPVGELKAYFAEHGKEIKRANPSQEVSSAAGKEGIHPESERKTAAVGDTNGSGQSHPTSRRTRY